MTKTKLTYGNEKALHQEEKNRLRTMRLIQVINSKKLSTVNFLI
jgi:hypothetical protein